MTRTVKVTLEADVVGYVSSVDRAAGATDKLHRAAEKFSRGRYDATLNVRTEKADRELGAFATRLDRKIRAAVAALPEVRLGIDANTDPVSRRIMQIKRELESLADQRIGIDVDAVAAQERVTTLSRELQYLSTQSANVQVRADTAAAAAQLGAIQAQANRLNGQNIQMTARVDGDRALSMIGLIIAGLSTVGALAPIAMGALGAVAAGGAGAAQTIGTVAAGFSGVGDAVKALGDAEAKSAVDSAAAGAARVATSHRVAAAHRAVEQAQIQADRSAITGDQQVRDAERDLTRAQEDSRRAQEDLTRARADAREELQQLQFSIEDLALAEEEAADRREEAAQRLAEARASGASAEDIEDLDRAYRRADLTLRQTTDRYRDAQVEGAKWAQTGIEGSDGVVNAQRRVADQARQVEQAQTRLDRAQQQAAWAQQDAARQVIDAQRQVAEAMAATGTAGTASANKVAEAMAALSPAGQRFAQFLHSEVLPALREVRDEIQTQMLPGVERGMRSALTLVPEFKAGMGETGRIIGELTDRGGRMVSSGPWRADFKTIMDSNNRALLSFGEAGFSVADSWRHLAVTGGPLVERLALAAARGAELAEQWLATRRSTGELDAMMTAAGDTLREVGEFLWQVAQGAAQLAIALGPLGGLLMNTVGALAEMIGNFAAANPLITQFIAGATLAVVLVAKLGTTITGLVASSAAARAGIATLGTTLAQLAPDALHNRLAQTAGLIDANGAATDRASTRTGTFLGALTRVGSYLPVLGLVAAGAAAAYDGLTVSSSEAAAAMEQGGAAAQAAIQGLARQTMAANLPLFGQGIDLVTTDLAEYRAGLHGVEAAQFEVALATANHRTAMEQFGPAAAQTQARAMELTHAQNALEQAQGAAGRATETHTQAMIRQRDTMLGNLNAEIQWQAALDRLTETVARNGATTDLNTAAGRENVTALNQMAEGAIRHLDSMNQQGAGFSAVSAKEREYRDGLLRSAMQIGMTRDEARRYVDQLHLVPARVNTTVHADTGPARAEIERFLQSARGQEIVFRARADTGSITAGATPYRPRASGGVDMMAAGGVRRMRRDIAAVVPPNQPVLMGDRMRGREYFLPDDDSPRTMAIGARWATDRGLRLVPMANGGMIQAEDGSWVPPSFYARPVTRRMIQAEDGSWVPPSFYANRGSAGDPRTLDQLQRAAEAARDALAALRTDGLDPLSPAFTDAQDAITAAITGMTGSIGQLQTSSNISWADMQARVGAEVATMIGPHFGALNLGHRLTEMSTAQLQALTNANWANMTTTTGLSVGQITGPIFGGLHAGMTGIADHATRTADWWGGQLDRIRALTANPVRWALDWPINRGLVPAWGEIDRFFALGRPWGGVPIGFAGGTEDHRATVARGGAPRLWNEPETGGEAYIPLAQTKRERSTGILSTVADQFGYHLVPRDLATYADGGLWRQMFGIVRRQFPDSRLTSAYRPGDPGYHGTGRATDLAGPMAAINRWLAEKFANSTQLIYTPGINLFRGRPHTYNAATRADHYDHVHWAMENAAMLGGAQGSYSGAAGGGFDPGPIIEEKLAATRRMIADIHRFHGPGNPAAAMTRASNDAVAGAVAKATELMATAMPGPGGGVERWRPVVHRALAMTGQPQNLDNTTLRRMNQESGGNPRAINNWDINAVRGTPSKGLMQVIDPTFRAHRHPQTVNDIWDPLANVAASIRYAMSRYGSLPAAYNRRGGYDSGGDWPPNTWGWNSSGQTEHVLRGPERVAFLELVETIRRAPTPIVARPAATGGLTDAAMLVPAISRAIGAQVAAHLDGVGLRIVDDGRAGLARVANRQNARATRRE